MKFKNPQNDYVEEVTSSMHWLWAFLWTPIYYAVKGIWTHAIASFVLNWVVGGATIFVGTIIFGVVYAFMNKSIVRKHYLKKGWIEVTE